MSTLLYPTTLVEVGVALLLLLLAALWPHRAARALARIEARLKHVPTSLGMQLLVVGLFAVLLRAAFLPWLGASVPLIPDEYSLVLQAQTFVEGRLANPVHPMWPHLQGMHVNQIPAYASMYFPGRGLPMVPGILLFDSPWLGVWLSFVLFAMSTVWMLRGWMDPRWALLGGMLVVLRLGAASYWINSYWGGAFAATGAMLVFGALPRLVKRPRWSIGLLLGLGALILMTTRPYEGAIFCAAAGLLFLPRLWRTGWPNLRLVATRAGIPLAACVVLGALAITQYNEATTGDALTTPYDVNREMYAIAPAFLISPPVAQSDRSFAVPAHYPALYEEEAEEYLRAKDSTAYLLSLELRKLYLAFQFYVGFAMAIPFLVGLWASRRDLPVIGTMVAVFAGHTLTTWALAHYVAPIFPVLLLITMRGLVVLGRWTLADRPVGYVYSRGVFLAVAAPLLVLLSHLTTGRPAIAHNSSDLPCCTLVQANEHSEVIERLKGLPGRDLVVVQHDAFYPFRKEMAYNEPDIDASPVVFAHSLSEAADRRLLAYFRNRRLWTLRFTADGYALEPLAR